MQSFESPMFTPAEAAVLTHLSLKAVHNAIDRKTVTASTDNAEGYGARLLGVRALMSLALERRLADRFMPEARRELFEALDRGSRQTVSLDGGFLQVDLRESRRELARSIRQLRRAKQLVISDPGIMGGDPVFRGTRVPVHAIAAQRAQNESEADILESYPRLTLEMVQLAPLYAAAYPLRGRPRRQPWHDRPPILQIREKLSTFEAG
jgi:uncharacterized protein (DUF433 family)